MKYPIESFNSSIKQTEERIRELGDISNEIKQSAKEKEKRVEQKRTETNMLTYM